MKKKNIITIVLVLAGTLLNTITLPAMSKAIRAIRPFNSLRIINKTPYPFWRGIPTPKEVGSGNKPTHFLEIKPHSKIRINKTFLFLELLLVKKPGTPLCFAVGNEITSLVFEQQENGVSLKFVYEDPLKSDIITLAHPIEFSSDSHQASDLNFYDDPCIIS